MEFKAANSVTADQDGVSGFISATPQAEYPHTRARCDRLQRSHYNRAENGETCREREGKRFQQS